ncbi:ER degradation-enhancing alpha-mannosidase-like 1 [Verticillium dahliae VDG1]|nr:ER degradation-enhancing alpha-mannosidase-like 1 [Verticillium dahliae VDG1]
MTSPTQPTLLISSSPSSSPLVEDIIASALSSGTRVRLTSPLPAHTTSFAEAAACGKLTITPITTPDSYRTALDNALALLDATMKYGTFVRKVVYAAPSLGSRDEGWNPARGDGVIDRWVEERSAGAVKVPFGVVCMGFDIDLGGKGLEGAVRRAVEI